MIAARHPPKGDAGRFGFSSANHPDNCLTIVRRSTICLSEYYNKKPDNLTVFQQFSFLLRISDMYNFYSYRPT